MACDISDYMYENTAATAHSAIKWQLNRENVAIALKILEPDTSTYLMKPNNARLYTR